MSIATAISRLQGLKNRLVTKLSGWGNSPTDLEDCVDLIEGETQLSPSNVRNGVNILGISGTYDGSHRYIQGSQQKVNSTSITIPTSPYTDIQGCNYALIALEPNSGAAIDGLTISMVYYASGGTVVLRTYDGHTSAVSASVSSNGLTITVSGTGVKFYGSYYYLSVWYKY